MNDLLKDPIWKAGICIITIVLTILMMHSCYGIDLGAIETIESSGNPLAHNKATGARGAYQITPICLQEWNNYHPNDTHTAEELFNYEINRKIAVWYLEVRIPEMLRYYGKPVTVRNILISYNFGIKHVVEGTALPDETKAYIKLYLTKEGLE